MRFEWKQGGGPNRIEAVGGAVETKKKKKKHRHTVKTFAKNGGKGKSRGLDNHNSLFVKKVTGQVLAALGSGPEREEGLKTGGKKENLGGRQGSNVSLSFPVDIDRRERKAHGGLPG